MKYYNDLTATSLEIMVSKGNHPQRALIQVSEILYGLIAKKNYMGVYIIDILGLTTGYHILSSIELYDNMNICLSTSAIYIYITLYTINSKYSYL